MHSPDEYIYVDDFNKDIAIYAHAIYALGHVSK
jgi:acetylornithine deacetylase/succinyl-diaminopimelate desuccinylase-like protein